MACGWNPVACGWNPVACARKGVFSITFPGSSGTLKLIASTKLRTSFIHFSGITEGKASPFNAKLHKCKLRANSGNNNDPVLLVSERDQISAKVTGGNPDRKRISLAESPEIDCSPGLTAVLKRDSNLFWSEAVMNDNLMEGILTVESEPEGNPVCCGWIWGPGPGPGT